MPDHKIAVFFPDERYDKYGDYEKVIEKISDWETVSEHDYKLLQEGRFTKGYGILEVPLNQREFIEITVSTLLEEVRQVEEEKLRRKLKAEKSAEANRKKNAENARQSKLKQLEKLQKELGLVPNETHNKEIS